ncbi:hypothetical protein BOTCAL_0538g00060 [Botryotinia calthae]|uniref:Uncharacterized protein n=1 Tax=Botryotinia calthae TaxID=38488 RepID=A0A4Y8CKF5_9HELO|nr:hypothetical protein BOTCAL_0538g00060 [Botryotinia calthae]
MTSPNNLQSLALNSSEKEHSRNITSNTDDDDDEMPAITHAIYIAELQQRYTDLEQRYAHLEQRYAAELQRYVDLQQQIIKQDRKYLTMLLIFLAALVVWVLNAKKYQKFRTF